MSALGAEVLAPPQRISHAPNLLWWLALAAFGFFLYREEVFSSRSHGPPVLRRGVERESFLALSFGKIGEEGPDVIPLATFREQLDALKSAGYSPVSLRELDAFYREHRGLAEKPVVLMFDGVQRDSTELADAALAAHDFHGVAFADTEGLTLSNIDLVSTHRLRQMVDSGRWEVGISGCNHPPDAQPGENPSPLSPPEAILHARDQLHEWTRHPITSVSCERYLGDKPENVQAWREMMGKAGLSVGFVVANPGANYVDDSPIELRRIRVSRDWKGQDLLAALDARMPKRTTFRDDFDRAPSPSWVVDRGQLTIDKGVLQLTARPGDNGALLTLAGSERWSDAEAEISVERVTEGQLWIGLRNAPGSFLRLGVVGSRAVLQTSDAHGQTHDMGSRDLPKGKFVLGLRVSGAHAIATLDGEMLGDRPVEVPATLRRGPLSMSVWDPKGNSSARVSRVVATPLPTRMAIVAPHPGEGLWDELRRSVGDLAVLSPKQYAVAKNGPVETEGDPALSIFAHHHRLLLMPSVTLEGDGTALPRAHLLRWAKQGGIDGLNLVVPSRVASNAAWLHAVEEIRQELEHEDRHLSVTLSDAHEVPAWVLDGSRTFAMSAHEGRGLQIAQSAIRFSGATL